MKTLTRNIDEDRYMPFEVGDEICLIEYVMEWRSSYIGRIRYINEDYYKGIKSFGVSKDKDAKKKMVLGKWNKNLDGRRNIIRGKKKILEKILGVL